MADHTKSITDSIQVLGPGYPVLWNSMIWGTDPWGMFPNPFDEIGKNISEAITGTDILTKLLDVIRSFSNSVTASDSITSVTLQNSNGWYYEFADHTTNAAERDFVTWTDGSNNTSVWVKSSTTATTWGDST